MELEEEDDPFADCDLRVEQDEILIDNGLFLCSMLDANVNDFLFSLTATNIKLATSASWGEPTEMDASVRMFEVMAHPTMGAA